MRRWMFLDPRNHFTRSDGPRGISPRDGRVILAASVLGLVILGASVLTSHMGLAPWNTNAYSTGPSARGTDSTPSPAPDGPEVHGEREAIRQDGREARREKSANWIWAPTADELAAHKTGSAMLFTGPIVDKLSGVGLKADVYVNDQPVARTDRVEVLMWDTQDQPVFVAAVRADYKRWELRYRFQLNGLKRVEGPVRLEPNAYTGRCGELAREVRMYLGRLEGVIDTARQAIDLLNERDLAGLRKRLEAIEELEIKPARGFISDMEDAGCFAGSDAASLGG